EPRRAQVRPRCPRQQALLLLPVSVPCRVQLEPPGAGLDLNDRTDRRLAGQPSVSLPPRGGRASPKRRARSHRPSPRGECPMKNAACFLLACGALAAVAGGFLAGQSGPAADKAPPRAAEARGGERKADEDAIRKLSAELTRALEKGDPK